MEKAGFPTALICTLTTIALNQGAPRVVAGKGIPHPLGRPGSTPSEEQRLREELVRKALYLLCTRVDKPTLME